MPTIHDEHWREDFRYRQELREQREIEESHKPKEPLEVLDAPNVRIERDSFFPWFCDFRDEEPNYLHTVLGKADLDVSNEAEDCQSVEQNEQELFLSAVKGVKRI